MMTRTQDRSQERGKSWKHFIDVTSHQNAQLRDQQMADMIDESDAGFPDEKEAGISLLTTSHKARALTQAESSFG
jgi:hypothetical protein